MGRKSKAKKLPPTFQEAKDSGPTLEIVLDNLEGPTLEIVLDNLETGMPKKSVVVSKEKKASTNKSLTVRRSGRLQNLHKPTGNQEIEPVIEEINLVESEREDEPHMEEYNHEPLVESDERDDGPRVEDCNCEPHIDTCAHEPIPNEKSLKGKVDYLMQTVEELKSKVMKWRFPSENTSTDLSYKSLYINSQKKFEELTAENQELAKDLEVALGKVEAYENFKGVMEKFKDVMMISNMAKATDAMVKLSSQAVLGQFSSPGVVVEPCTAAAPETSLSKKRKRGKKD